MLFFLLVIACSQGSLFLAFGHRSRFPLEHSTQRYVIATAALVLVWLVMLGAAVVALYAELDANQFMPPLERLAHVITLLLLGWAFLSADFILWRNRSNLFIFGCVFLLTLLFINTARSWLLEYPAGLAFNASEYAPLWSAITAGLAAGLLLLTALNTRHIADAPLKALLFLLFVAGSAWELGQIAQGQVDGNYQGAARLSYAAALVLLPVIIHRLAIALLENSLVEVVLAASQQAAAVPAEATGDTVLSPHDGFSLAHPNYDTTRLLAAIGVMLESDHRADEPDRVVETVQNAFAVELCMLILRPDNNLAEIVAGRDATTQKTLAGAQLDLSEQPTLLAAAKRGDTVTLLPDHHTDELHELFRRIGVDGFGSLLVQPLLARGQLLGLLLLGSPYSQAGLDEADRALLADIAVVAGFLLAGETENRQEPQRAAAHPSDAFSARPGAGAPSSAVMLGLRRELTAGLAGSAERIAKLRLQIGGLEKQLADEQGRLLDRLAESDLAASASVGLRGAFCEQAALLSACETSANALLDAEAALRLLNGSDTLEQSLQEYLHKQYNWRLNTRDRLRRQIGALRVLRRSTPGDALATIAQQLNDEHDQLALQRDQQRRRQASIAQHLETLGITDIGATMLPALVHLQAERLAFGELLTEADARLAALQAEHQALLDAGAGDKQELETQLKQLSADHEALLESREALRREQQQILAQTEAAEVAISGLENDKQLLETSLAEEKDRQRETQNHIEELVEERDNLLTIRDQLTARVTKLMEEETTREPSAQLQNELEMLRESVARLSQQREDLALDLSDARLETAHAPEPAALSARTAATLLSLLRDLYAPIGSVRDYVDLLLAESIGILGAAQLQVLRLASAEIGVIADLLAELQHAASADAGRIELWDDIDIAAMLDEVIAETSARVAEKSLLIELNLDDKLPPLAANFLGVKHMLTLLMTNACEVSPPGARVFVSARKEAIQLNDNTGTIDALEVRVHDAGGGISSSDLPRLFTRAYREHYPAIPGLGDTGVGITVARAIARAHEGDIWVTSEQGKGSTFHLALPLQSAATTEA